MKIKLGYILALTTAIIIILAIGTGVKIHMDNEAKIRHERNMAVKKLQEEVSDYIINNYSGIEKIEWIGWNIGPGPFSIDTAMTINGYQDETNGKVQFSYSVGSSQHIKKYTDLVMIDKESELPERTPFQEMGIKYSKEGSQNVEIIYNWEEDK